MTHVYIIDLVYEYEGHELVDVCIDDLELAKRLAKEHFNTRHPEEDLLWKLTDYNQWFALSGAGGNYELSRCEVTEQ